MKIRWTQRAADQMLHAVDELEHERPGAGETLQKQVRRAIGLIQDHPRVFPRVPGDLDGEVRRALIRRYRHWLIFEIFEERDEVLVLSLWHTSRQSYETE